LNPVWTFLPWVESYLLSFWACLLLFWILFFAVIFVFTVSHHCLSSESCFSLRWHWHLILSPVYPHLESYVLFGRVTLALYFKSGLQTVS
jgi:hypothetical protein